MPISTLEKWKKRKSSHYLECRWVCYALIKGLIQLVELHRQAFFIRDFFIQALTLHTSRWQDDASVVLDAWVVASTSQRHSAMWWLSAGRSNWFVVTCLYTHTIHFTHQLNCHLPHAFIFVLFHRSITSMSFLHHSDHIEHLLDSVRFI